MKSQYLIPYMEETKAEIKKGKKPYAVGTFLKYRLRGNAKSWFGRYLYALIRGLESEGWKETKSKLGGRAYCP